MSKTKHSKTSSSELAALKELLYGTPKPEVIAEPEPVVGLLDTVEDLASARVKHREWLQKHMVRLEKHYQRHLNVLEELATLNRKFSNLHEKYVLLSHDVKQLESRKMNRIGVK